MTPVLSCRSAPRPRDLSDAKLYVPPTAPAHEALQPLPGALNVRHILTRWEDILRLAASIRQGTVAAPLMLRKLGSYPRQNGRAVALRELGRMEERTFFVLDWPQSVELRRRVQVGLHKGEARNALARAVFFHRPGEVRDRGFGQQRGRAGGPNPLPAAIVVWNTVLIDTGVSEGQSRGLTDHPHELVLASPPKAVRITIYD